MENYTVNMSQERGEAVCEICGSVEFSSQDGFYYCSVCNTQSQVGLMEFSNIINPMTELKLWFHLP